MRTLRVIACLLSAALLSAAAAGCGNQNSQGNSSGANSGEAEVVTLRLAGQSPQSSPAYAETEAFCERVKEESNGTLIIEYHPYNQLGDQAQVFEEVIMGTIDMSVTRPQESIVPAAAIGTLPALATSAEEMKAIVGPGTVCDGLIRDALAEIGIRSYGLYFGGLTGVATNKEVTAPADPTANKGVLIRTPTSATYTSSLSALGFTTSPIAYSEIYTSMQTGVIDGYAGGMPHTALGDFSDLVKYYYDYSLIAEAMNCMINQDVYDRLSDEHKAIIDKEFAALAANSFDVFGDYEDECMQKLEDNGVTVVRFTEEERSEYSKFIRDDWTILEDTFGKDLLDQVRAEANK